MTVRKPGSTKKQGQTAYSCDASERLLKAGNTSYSYDSNGNMTVRTVGKETTAFSYDSEDWMVGRVR